MAFETVVLSQRAVRPAVSRCMGYEFEDRATELLDARLVAPGHTRVSKMGERVVRRAARSFAPAIAVPPRYRSPEAPASIDLLVVHCQLPGDAMLVGALPDWRGRTHRAVAIVEEAWTGMLDSFGGHLRLLERFDHVYVGISDTARVLHDRLDTPVSYLPYPVDTRRFAPPDPLADRPIDVLNIGRRSAVTHAALLEWSIRDNRFYYFDSFSPNRCHDLEEHRIMYARLHQHAAFSISNRGVGTTTVVNEGEEALPARYFEAAAAGGVLVGQAPSIPEFDEQFGWTDAVIPAPFDAPEIADTITALEHEPARVQQIRLRNLSEASSRHDVAHRLRTILGDLGLPEPDAVTDRIDERARYADEIRSLAASIG